MQNSPLLEGSHPVPGCYLTDEEKRLFTIVLDKCKSAGLDFYPTIIQKVRWDEMAEIAAYGGFPHRYPHWYWGMQYESLKKGYEHNQSKIYEMIVNSCPAYIYIMNNNTLCDNICVVAHATAHNDFFKNNIFFEPTDTGMMDRFACNGKRIKRYMDSVGHEKVTEFIDHVLRIQTLIDPSKAWEEKKINEVVIKEKREYEFPKRLKVDESRLYMDPWVNPQKNIEAEQKRIEERKLAKELELFQNPEKDIFGFIKDNAPLRIYQQDIMDMLYEEALYFSPQRTTKTTNEGYASFFDYFLLCEQGLVSLGQKTHDAGIIEYATHKMQVLGGKYSMNPYKVGFYLLLDIRERWDKGRFGPAWENCKNLKEKENWDLKLNLGMDKIFQVRKYYNDFTLINEFLTQDFCDKFEFYEYKHYPNGEWRIESRDVNRIKRKLLQQHINGGLPDIRIVDPNHCNRGYLLLQHYQDSYDNRELYEPYTKAVLTSLFYFWKKEVILATRNKENKELIYVCEGLNPKKNVTIYTREEYEKNWMY